MELPYKIHKLELPDDVLAIIKDFSRPVTNPRWRHLHIMTNYKLHERLAYEGKNVNAYWTSCDYLYVLRIKHIRVTFRSREKFF